MRRSRSSGLETAAAPLRCLGTTHAQCPQYHYADTARPRSGNGILSFRRSVRNSVADFPCRRTKRPRRWLHRAPVQACVDFLRNPRPYRRQAKHAGRDSSARVADVAAALARGRDRRARHRHRFRRDLLSPGARPLGYRSDATLQSQYRHRICSASAGDGGRGGVDRSRSLDARSVPDRLRYRHRIRRPVCVAMGSQGRCRKARTLGAGTCSTVPNPHQERILGAASILRKWAARGLLSQRTAISFHVLARRRLLALLFLARLLRRVVGDCEGAALVVAVFLVRFVEGLEESFLLVLIILIRLGLRQVLNILVGHIAPPV